MNSRYISLCVLACSCLHGQNVVTDWANILHPAFNTPARNPAILNVLRATAHIAMFDAAVAVEGGFKPFANTVPAVRGANLRAAIATAAYRTGRPLVPVAQWAALDARYEGYLADIPAGEAKENGIRAGENAAAAVQSLRQDDGLNSVVLFECNSANLPVGRFEPDDGCGNQPVGVNVGQIRPFTFTDPTRFRTSGPNPMTSNGYLADFIETRDYGRTDSTVRSAEQTDAAYFWQAATDYQPSLINLVISRGLGVRDTARFFAMVYTAAADAAIVVKTEKTYADFNTLLREIENARIWAGLHWRHSMQHGADIGRRVATHVCDNFFRPAP